MSQEPGVDDFYKVVQQCWGKILPKVEARPVLQIIDLESPLAQNPKVKTEIPDVIDIPDDDESGLEESEFKSLSEEDLSVEQIQEKIEYLRCLSMHAQIPPVVGLLSSIEAAVYMCKQ